MSLKEELEDLKTQMLSFQNIVIELENKKKNRKASREREIKRMEIEEQKIKDIKSLMKSILYTLLLIAFLLFVGLSD